MMLRDCVMYVFMCVRGIFESVFADVRTKKVLDCMCVFAWIRVCQDVGKFALIKIGSPTSSARV